MALYTFKIKIYDPIIVNAFARLRKSRKQSAFTLEALKYFLASEQGIQVLNLMAKESAEHMKANKQGDRKEPPMTLPEVSQLKSVTPERQTLPAGEPSEDYCAAVLGKILN